MKIIATSVGLLLLCFSLSAAADFDKAIAQENIVLAKSLVEKTSTNLLNELEKNKTNLNDKALLRQFIEKHVLPATDMETVALRIVGSYWNQLDASQQEQLKTALAQLIVNSYATALASYQDEKVFIEGGTTVPDNHDNIRVNSRIDGGNSSLKVVYYLRKREEGIGIYDINVDGQQFSSTYKASLEPSINKADFKGLIAILAKQGG